MSRLEIKGHFGEKFKMNVLQFRSPMNAEITSAQTRLMMHHHPIRCGQPDVQFTVKFISQDEKDIFERFVRRHQIQAQEQRENYLKLWWPERGMDNWTGYISEYQVSVRRFDPAPEVTFGVSLVDSMMSRWSEVASTAANFTTSMLNFQPLFDVWGMIEDGILQPPPNLFGLDEWGPNALDGQETP
jgi:hypothetical protein